MSLRRISQIFWKKTKGIGVKWGECEKCREGGAIMENTFQRSRIVSAKNYPCDLERWIIPLVRTWSVPRCEFCLYHLSVYLSVYLPLCPSFIICLFSIFIYNFYAWVIVGNAGQNGFLRDPNYYFLFFY